MSVGGKIIEIRDISATKVAIWVLDSQPGCETETCVHAERAEDMPKVGDAIWWQSGQIMFDGDRKTLRKIGFSHRPQTCREGEEKGRG